MSLDAQARRQFLSEYRQTQRLVARRKPRLESL
jgi:hypothetical protein